jgi:hypothetical protein
LRAAREIGPLAFAFYVPDETALGEVSAAGFTHAALSPRP